MITKSRTKLVHEGQYAAEVDIELVYEDHEWAPYLSLDDTLKLDEVRLALRQGHIDVASKLARVFELMPVTA